MTSPGKLIVQHPSEETLKVILSGNWRLDGSLPSAADVQHAVEGASGLRNITLDARQVSDWDTGLLTFLVGVRRLCARQEIRLDADNLPDGAKKLLALASAVPEKKDARQAEKKARFLTHVGNETVNFFLSSGELLEFIGDAVVAIYRMLRGKAQFRRADLGLIIESCGAKALPIVTLICFLVGLILAFIGAIQLKLFGAQIYVADLVGIAMVRLMGAIMTGIVMAGRTGGAFAAQLGTMQVNQEIDALKTLGISPMEFLVLPRMLALALMMPLLVPLRQRHGHPGGDDGGRGDARYRLHPVLQRDRQGGQPVEPGHRPFFRHRLRGDRGAFRMHAGHAVRPERLGGGGCRHLRGGHRHCRDHCFNRRDHPGMQHARGIRRLGRLATRRARRRSSRKRHDRKSKPHITVQDLTMAYGDFVLMRDLTFTINHGDVFIIMGGSGCGKSTMMTILIGLKTPARGRVILRRH